MIVQRRNQVSRAPRIRSVRNGNRASLKRRDLEAQHGRALVAWADLMAASLRPELHFLLHVPNGGARSAATGAELKRQGVRRGVWDYLLPVPRPEAGGRVSAYAGLWSELKEPGARRAVNGGLSPHQLAFGRFVRAHGYATVVAYDWTEARDAITAYLDAQPVPFFWCL